MPHNTGRGTLPVPDLPDTADVPRDFVSLANRLNVVAVFFDQGAIASRPASPGAGFIWWATDVHIASYYDGATWWDLNPGAASYSVDPAQNIGGLRTLGPGHQQAAPGDDLRLSDKRVPVDGSVGTVQVASALKPSAGAGAGTEALRALGAAVGLAAAGLHAAQHGPLGADPLDWLNIITQFVPSKRLASAEITADADITASTEGSASIVMTAPSVTLDGSTKIIVEIFVPSVFIDANGPGKVIFVLYDNGSSIGKISSSSMTTGFDYGPLKMEREFTTAPSAGGHTYSVRAYLTTITQAHARAGNGSSGQFVPATIRISKT